MKKNPFPFPEYFRVVTGFTLLEVMIALAVLSIVLVSVYKMQGQTISMAGSAGFHAEAPMLADMVLSRFDSSTEKDRFSDGDGGVFDEPFSHCRWRVRTAEAIGGFEDEIVKDMIRIEIEIERIEDGRTFGLVAYRFSRP